MADPNLIYDPVTGFLNTTTFPTSPTSETATRTLFQRLFTQVQTFLNDTVIVWINATFATNAALTAAVLSGIADDSITNAKMATDVKLGSLATIDTTAKTSFEDSINEIVARLVLAEASVASLTSEADADIGIVKYMASSTVPARHLECKGQAVLIATYPKLAVATYCGDATNATAEFGYKCTNPANPTGTRSTAGTYITIFEGRGVVPRGWDNGKGYDTGRVFGSYQADGLKTHGHTNTVSTTGSHTHGAPYGSGGPSVTCVAIAGVGNLTPTYGLTTNANGDHTHTVTINDYSGTTENIMKNSALLCIVKY